MKDCGHDDLVARDKIHHGIRKPPDQTVPNVFMDHRVYLRVAADQLHATINAANALSAEPASRCSYHSYASFKSASAAGRKMTRTIIALRQEYGF